METSNKDKHNCLHHLEFLDIEVPLIDIKCYGYCNYFNLIYDYVTSQRIYFYIDM